jgi:hypothetical protein
MGCAELGSVSLSEIAAARGKLGLPIERDLWFEADKKLLAYARASPSTAGQAADVRGLACFRAWV